MISKNYIVHAGKIGQTSSTTRWCSSNNSSSNFEFDYFELCVTQCSIHAMAACYFFLTYIIFHQGNRFLHCYLYHIIASGDFIPLYVLRWHNNEECLKRGGEIAPRLLPVRSFFYQGNRNALCRQIIGSQGWVVGGGPKGKNPGLDWPL